MPVTAHDIQLLEALAKHFVLTREQLQRLCSPDTSDRSVRKHLSKLQHGDLITKHRMPVMLPDGSGAAPVYYLTQEGASVLAAWFEDERYHATNTRQPRSDRLNHWFALNETRMVIEQALRSDPAVTLDGWISEWEIVDKDATEGLRYTLHTQLRETPPLSCSPDAALLLTTRGVSKVFYIEQDLGTSSPHQVASRKTKGYAELARQLKHRTHFPQTNIDSFSILFITPTKYRCVQLGKELRHHESPELWRMIDQHELTTESFLHGQICYQADGSRTSLIRPASTAAGTPVASAALPEGGAA